MNSKRRKLIQAIGGTGVVAAASPYLSFPALAQSGPLKIGIIAPKAGIAGTIGECGLRGTMFAVERINASGGIAGRKVELIVEEETNPKDSIERLSCSEVRDLLRGLRPSATMGLLRGRKGVRCGGRCPDRPGVSFRASVLPRRF